MRTLRLSLALIVIPMSAQAQTASSLVGTWRLVSYVANDSSGQPQPVWDTRPVGELYYTADGHMALQFYDGRRPRLGVEVESASAEVLRAMLTVSSAYFGRYAVDSVAHTVTTTIEGALLPDRVGARITRTYRFITADQLELRVGDLVTVWQRLRP